MNILVFCWGGGGCIDGQKYINYKGIFSKIMSSNSQLSRPISSNFLLLKTIKLDQFD